MLSMNFTDIPKVITIKNSTQHTRRSALRSSVWTITPDMEKIVIKKGEQTIFELTPEEAMIWSELGTQVNANKLGSNCW